MPLLCTGQKILCNAWSLSVSLLLISTIGDSQAASYTIIPERTHIRFAIERFNTSVTTGGFYDIKGQLQYDPSRQTGDISLIIPMGSLSTDNPSFTNSLTGPDFFDAKKHPSARFKSTKWYFNQDKTPQVTRVDGKLTLHGETHPISLTATHFGCDASVNLKQEACSGNFIATIDRTKWNINKFVWFGLTKNFNLNIKVAATRQ